LCRVVSYRIVSYRIAQQT